ncbi:retrovirus-related pol polyprotein from transposon TNT 1-94 [Tanacetum coccineum]
MDIPKDLLTHQPTYYAKDIWDNVKMILEGSELTKDDRESQLYDEFEHFRQIKGETIHGYYVRFTKLINDMRNIKMTMPRMQLNSKFVNNMLPKWSRFITEVKLNRGLKEYNFDQLYAYLKQHEVHANEYKTMMERFLQPTNDPLALVSNASVQQPKGLSDSTTSRNKMLLLQAMRIGVVLDEEQSLFLQEETGYQLDDDVDDSPENDWHSMWSISLKLDHVNAFDSDIQSTMKTAVLGHHMNSNYPFEVNQYLEDNEEMDVQRVNTSTEASGSKPRSNTKKNKILPAKKENKKKVTDHPSSVNSTPTVKIVLNKGKQIWKPKGKLSDNSLNKTKRVWKATGKLFDDIGCSKHMTGNRSKLKNFVQKFIGTVRFRNDHFGAIMDYGDYVIGDSVISRVYYVEGLGHNLFFVGKFCDSDLEVAFRKHSCFIRDINDADLLKGSRSTNLYTISIDDMMKSSPICLLSKASKSKSWLWHHRLNHLNFGIINDLARKDLVRGLPRLKFEKDHLCSACQLGKSKKFSHKPKYENSNMEVIHTLHMDLCDNGTEFVKQVMSKYYEGVGIFHQKSIPRTPQQNGVVKRRNRTLVEAARTMMIFSKAPMFIWAKAIATACYTQNRSLIYTRHNKTPYELIHDKKFDLTFLRVFGALCYLTNDSEDLRKFQAKADIGIFVGYAPSRKGYKIYNKRTHRLMETIHVTFDEMHQTMALVRISSGPEPIIVTSGQLKSGLAPTDK